MARENSVLTVIVSHPKAKTYVQLIEMRFPRVRAIDATDRGELERHIGEADALLAYHFPVEVFDKAKKLRWYQSTGSGVDSMIPIRHKSRHITVTNARGIHGDIMADYVMAGATMLQWGFPEILRDQAKRKWNPRLATPLADKTLGVIGLGSIGTTSIARRAKSAGMTVIGSKRDVSQPIEGVDRLFPADALEDLLSLCDFVVLAVPATVETSGLIGASEIAKMRRHAFLINIARGDIVVEVELIDALRSGTIAGAMLDVFEREPLSYESPLWGMPNVIVTPHVAGAATNYTERVFSIFADNLVRFLEGRPLKNVVDLARGY
ncbi:phosphoglycerate dehydrogenase-like enzyme [Bradyrhizobium sp. GM24.11]